MKYREIQGTIRLSRYLYLGNKGGPWTISASFCEMGKLVGKGIDIHLEYVLLFKCTKLVRRKVKEFKDMTALQQLLAAEETMVCFIRDTTDEHLSIFPKSSGGYWLVIKKGTGRNGTKKDIACASFDDLVSQLLPGEAESPEWFPM